MGITWVNQTEQIILSSQASIFTDLSDVSTSEDLALVSIKNQVWDLKLEQ